MSAATDKVSWRFLRTLSDCALLVTAVVWIFQWHNDNQFERVINDPVAKQFWIETRGFYELVAWISIAGFIVLRLSYWTIEYVHDRRIMSRRKEETSQHHREQSNIRNHQA